MLDNKEKNRVCCLYRVSTDQQVDYDKSHTADIPMQRIVCHEFAKRHNWEIVKEVQEEGVSGHKVRAANRDGIQKIKEAAINGEFDILLVFMFDRLGRIADETPFVVEWFVRNGIRVWSTQEGEQKFESHADKLMNYIRFWQADGESEKTSIRTSTRLRQLTEEGHFKGGTVPYGYRLVRGDRVNKKKHELYELEIVPEEATIVRLIFQKYVEEGYGPQRIATTLNNMGSRTRAGNCWHPATINGMTQNLTYTGVLRCANSRSEVIPQLQIISPETYERALEIRESRANAGKAPPIAPHTTKGKSLLIGNVFCATCGARLNVTNNIKKDAKGNEVVRFRYVCYGKVRKQTQCTGQTGYIMEQVDGAVDTIVRGVFRQMQGVDRHEIIQARYDRLCAEQKAVLKSLHSEFASKERDINHLKSEILKSLKGESAFSTDLLSSMMKEAEAKLQDVASRVKEQERACQESFQTMKMVERQYKDILNMAELYEGSSMEAKKMVVTRMIERVDVGRGYDITITLRQEFKKFFESVEHVVPGTA